MTTVWARLREYAATQAGPFTSQEAISWFARHYPGTNDKTLRTHIRNASWNVGDRSWASAREPFLTKVDRGLFRRATEDEVRRWRAEQSSTPTPLPDARASAAAAPTERSVVGPSFEWYTEAETQRLLVEWLKQDGWSIVRTANTATREHGVDVVAEKDGQRLGVEVKGFPSRFYVAGPKKGEEKPTKPVEQSKKWFAHALVPAMKLRTMEPEWRSVMCFPDFPVYRALHGDTASSLLAAGIEVWLVQQEGQVEVLD